MATYKGIQGYAVKKLSSDPTASSAIAGQLWYNSTSGAFKLGVVGAGSWASAPSLNTARQSSAAAGTQIAALLFGGSPAPVYTYTESYNGSSWSVKNTLNTGRWNLAGANAGTNTATLAISGGPPETTIVEEWDGTSWTEVNNLAVGRQELGGAGTAPAALAWGGWNGSANVGTTEKYDGTSWTEVNNLTTARQCWGCGINTAALSIGGEPPTSAIVEEWDGTCWTEVADLNAVRSYGGVAGTTALALCFGGIPGHLATTEAWDGTSWSEVADLATAVKSNVGAGIQAAALSIGGDHPPSTATVEAWSDPVYAIKTVTVS